MTGDEPRSVTRVTVEQPRAVRPAAVGRHHELERLADEVLPALIARLGVSGLGELEVSEGTWRVRLRREAAPPEAPAAAGARPSVPASGTSPAAELTRRMATSPAVGYFTPRPGLAVGQAVSAGDGLGWIDVLGVRQEVVAPVDGAIGRLLAEPGQAVEYGQELVHLDIARPAPVMSDEGSA